MIGAFVAFAAVASQVFYEELPLADVVSSADAAVIVDVGADGMRSVEIPIPGSPEKSCGTYTYGVWRVTVREVVTVPRFGPALSPGQVINVFPGNTADLIDLSRMACVEGMSVSPIFFVFHGEAVDPGDRLLVLLKWSAPYGWVEATSGSWLSPDKAGKVKNDRSDGLVVEPAPPAELLCVDDADCRGKAVCRDMRCKEP